MELRWLKYEVDVRRGDDESWNDWRARKASATPPTKLQYRGRLDVEWKDVPTIVENLPEIK